MAETSRGTLICRMAYSMFGIVVGVSVFIVWLVLFNTDEASIHTVSMGGLSGVLAAWNFVTHTMHLQDLWRTWLKGLKYFMYFGGLFILISLAAFFTYLALAISKHQKLSVDSFYISCVWSFICIKWSVMLFYHSRNYRNEFSDLTALLEF